MQKNDILRNAEGKRKRLRPRLSRLSLVCMVTAILYGCLGPGWMGRGGCALAGETGIAGESAGNQDEGNVITPGNKDLDRLYLELLKGKKKEAEPKSVLKAEGKTGYYKVVLVNGGTLRAKIIEIDKGTVTITDDRGMVYKVPRQEIFGFEEKDGKGEGGFGR